MTDPVELERLSKAATQEDDDVRYYGGPTSTHRPARDAYHAALVQLHRTGQLVHEQAPKDVVGWLYTRGEDDADILLDYRDSELRQAGYKEEALCRTKAAANRKFRLGDRVTKTKGSSWTGLVVGFYSTSLTPIGYAVESENEPGSVQIYPESALDAVRGKQ